ncbi:MAG: hypothetical protein POELPBGB_01555 [Bacteroidia bacterium]|nr:hypothetical protein [Bacteroidia bacterium]
MSSPRIISLLKGKCPKCETGDVFKTKGNLFLFQMPVMNETCPHCAHKFEREPGFFWGAMYVSYALAVAEMVSVFVAWSVLLPDAAYDYKIIVLFISVLVLLIFPNFRLSRIIWMYFFTKKEA